MCGFEGECLEDVQYFFSKVENFRTVLRFGTQSLSFLNIELYEITKTHVKLCI